MFIDIHTHLTDRIYLNDTDNLVKNFVSGGVGFVVDAGYDEYSSIKAFENSENYSEVYSVIGIHPENVSEYTDKFVEFMLRATSHPKCVGIGEIGLDYHYEGYDKALQKECFIKQIAFADKVNIPFVVHSRDASKDVCDLLTANKNNINNGFLMHCYSESYEQAKNYLDLGAYFSFGGVITFKNSHREDVVSKLPIDRVLAETDAPYLSPEPFRGKVNYAQNVSLVYKKLAEIYNVSVEELENQLQKNACALFKKINASIN